jgi:alanine-glyoxylate transaminase/serine-glyoxylate transaminase/serine-pyruvate transaminase
MFDTGYFAGLWRNVALRLGLIVDFVPGDWRHGVDPAIVEATLKADRDRTIKAVAIVHNETSTGVTSRVAEVRNAMECTGHPALLLVDTISSLGSVDYRHDEWGVDVTVGCSQKGLMLPPGIGINVISEKALAASKTATLSKSYWDWAPMLADNKGGFFPYTPPTNLLFGLREALRMLLEEGLEHVLARHSRHAEATRLAIRAWELELLAKDPKEYSSSLSTVVMPEGFNADVFRAIALERFDLSLGTGLGRLKGKVFRIGHLGSFNDLMLAGTLSGVEMGLTLAGVTFRKGGVQTALEYLARTV